MASTIKNTAYSVHILDILEYGLSKGCYSDVTISMPGQKKVIKCHKSVLARSSMFMAHLLESTTKDSEEETHITLCDMSFGEVMAMMNLVYVGKVHLNKIQMEKTRSAAKSFLNIDAVVEKYASSEKVENRLKRKKVPPPISPKSVSSKRPLLIKNSFAQQPIVFVMSGSSTANQHHQLSSVKSESHLPPGSEVSMMSAESEVGAAEAANEMNPWTMNSYQRAKLRCADKFKCEQCGKGFPLSCLLQRHKRTHSEMKPFACSYCEKSFSSKTSLNHHLFMKHLEEQSKKIEVGKKLLETLKREQSERVGGPSSAILRDDNVVHVNTATPSEEYIINRGEKNTKTVENMEIIGVQDITQQIAMQMRREDSVIQENHQVGDCANLYYIEGAQVGDFCSGIQHGHC